MYLVWYGNWASPSAQNIVTTFISSLSGSSYLNMGSTYYHIIDGVRTHSNNIINYVGGTNIYNSTYGTTLADSAVYYIIKGRWLEAEPYIMKDPEWAYWYARDIIKGRWPEAEPYIMTDEYWWDEYKEHFKIQP